MNTIPYEASFDFAKAMDTQDPLQEHRSEFYFPQHDGKDCLYFCGNSLGLQPKSTQSYIERELEHWRTHGVEGHFRGDHPWMHYHKYLQPQSADVVGAQESEVVVMNTLTVNLHLLMVTFYRPTKDRFKIIMEAGAFPSDQYAVESQVKWHGLNPDEAIVEIAPRAGEETLRTEDILEIIEQHGQETALVLFGGVNYYTGQFFDLQAITEVGHHVGAYVGFDLAHAAGNVLLKLHDWNVDFATWCSYKYLNAGPGGPSGVFIHDRHGNNPALLRFAGWWGHDETNRFLMRKGFIPMTGAAGWQLSNAQIFSFAAHRASLDIFAQATMPALRKKSEQLTGYLEFLLEKLNQNEHRFHIITPKNPAERGCQLSVLTDEHGKQLFDYLSTNGVICDWREPNVIRFAPVPLYNCFQDVWELTQLLQSFSN
ncbi:MAG: kynureninase [Saprospiraceae bacterium]|nr:kynureninase [Saprospiraceae bacterium]